MVYDDVVEQSRFLKSKKIYNFSEPISLDSLQGVKILNDANDWVKIEEEYSKNKIAVIDNFINPEFAFRLRKFMLLTNLRHDLYKDYAAVNFYPRPGSVWFPILTTLVKECKETITFLNELIFERAWSFIYTNNSDGVKVHADPASVNINFWVTPDDSFNLQEDYNGMNIWPIPRPSEWSQVDYVGNDKKSEEFLISSGVLPVKISYSFNRAVIFDSSFFHKTQKISSRPGYENRRVNYTLLFSKCS